MILCHCFIVCRRILGEWDCSEVTEKKALMVCYNWCSITFTPAIAKMMLERITATVLNLLRGEKEGFRKGFAAIRHAY